MGAANCFDQYYCEGLRTVHPFASCTLFLVHVYVSYVYGCVHVRSCSCTVFAPTNHPRCGLVNYGVVADDCGTWYAERVIDVLGKGHRHLMTVSVAAGCSCLWVALWLSVQCQWSRVSGIVLSSVAGLWS